MHPNAELLTRFYNAFVEKDAETMAACYHPDATFRDPAFQLEGDQPGWMWRMLIERGADLKVEFRDVSADDTSGVAHWEAWYTFSTTGRSVHNVIDAAFTFEDGLIRTHVDTFDFHTWSSQSLGLVGRLFGWTGFLQRKVSTTAMGQLERYMAKRKKADA